MNCDLFAICGFVRKYNTPHNVACHGFITRFCKGPDKDKCKRLEYRRAYGLQPEDEMLPTGLIVKIDI